MQVRDIAFLDTDTLFWQLAQQHSLQYQAHSRAGIPNLGVFPVQEHADWLSLKLSNTEHTPAKARLTSLASM